MIYRLINEPERWILLFQSFIIWPTPKYPALQTGLEYLELSAQLLSQYFNYDSD